MKKILIFAVSLIGVALLGMFIVMGVENKAISLDENVIKAEGQIKAQEKRRFDLIPNLVECVKQYDEHEYKTLRDVIAARGGQAGDTDVEEIKLAIKAVAEAYPDLKAQKNYQDLMNELANTENKIAQNREFYNGEVRRYRLYVRQFPSKQILRMRGYEVKDYEPLTFEHSSEDAPSVGDIFNRG